MDTIHLGYEASFSDSVPTEIRLRSLLKPFENLQGEWIAIPGTHTHGGTVMFQFNTSVWPASIRPMIRRKLLLSGGVPLESQMELLRDSKERPYVQPATNKASSSPALTVVRATDDEDPPLKPAS